MDLWLENKFAVEVWCHAATFEIPVPDVLATWGVTGDQFDETLRKVSALVAENRRIDAERIEQAKKATKDKGQKTKRPS